MKDQLVRQRIKHLVEQGGVLEPNVTDKHHITKAHVLRVMVIVTLTVLSGLILHARFG